MPKLKRLKYIRNPQELAVALQAEFSSVFDRVGEKMLKNLQDGIMRDVYMNEYFPNYRYWRMSSTPDEESEQNAFPTFEFLTAWKVESKADGSISLYFDPKSLSVSPHKSLVGNKDTRAYIAEMLNVNGPTSGYTVGSAQNGTQRFLSKLRKPYWDRFNKRLSKEGLMRRWILEEARAQGLEIS